MRMRKNILKKIEKANLIRFVSKSSILLKTKDTDGRRNGKEDEENTCVITEVGVDSDEDDRFYQKSYLLWALGLVIMV